MVKWQEDERDLDFESEYLMGTAQVRVGKNIQFGYRVDLYLNLVEISGADVLPSFVGDLFTIPNIPKSTFRVIVDRLADHPSMPSFRFKPRGSI